VFLFTALLLLFAKSLCSHLQACQKGQQAANIENEKVRDPSSLGGRRVRGRGPPRGRLAVQPSEHFQPLVGGHVNRFILPTDVSSAVLK